MRMKEGKSTADTENLLNEGEYVPFWIKAHDGSLITDFVICRIVI